MNTLDLSEEERDLLASYARSGDLALVADEFGIERGLLRRTLSYLCHFDTGKAAELVAAYDAARAPAAADPVAEPELVAPDPVPAETVLAEYGAATCPPCNYIGPAGEHACPTTPVIVRILAPAGAA